MLHLMVEDLEGDQEEGEPWVIDDMDAFLDKIEKDRYPDVFLTLQRLVVAYDTVRQPSRVGDLRGGGVAPLGTTTDAEGGAACADGPHRQGRRVGTRDGGQRRGAWRVHVLRRRVCCAVSCRH